MFNLVFVPAIVGVGMGLIFKALGGTWVAFFIPSVIGILLSIVASFILAGMSM